MTTENRKELLPSEAFATDCRGWCICGNNGGGDCDWCQLKNDWEINGHEWRFEAWPVYRQWFHAQNHSFSEWLWLMQGSEGVPCQDAKGSFERNDRAQPSGNAAG